VRIKWKILVIISALFLLTGCGGDENEKNDYSGVGKLISNRNKARIKNSSSTSEEKNGTSPYSADDEEIATPKKKSPGMTFEENVKIVSERSGKTIARATAYLDKSGKLIKIRIRKSH